MAGSYKHVVDENNKLISNEKFPDMIENLGDAYEAIEECWHFIDILTGGDKEKIAETHLKYVERTGGNAEFKKAIKVVRETIAGDKELRDGYQANIAMAFYDAYRNSKSKKLSVIRKIANEAADNFLTMWCK